MTEVINNLLMYVAMENCHCNMTIRTAGENIFFVIFLAMDEANHRCIIDKFYKLSDHIIYPSQVYLMKNIECKRSTLENCGITFIQLNNLCSIYQVVM